MVKDENIEKKCRKETNIQEGTNENQGGETMNTALKDNHPQLQVIYVNDIKKPSKTSRGICADKINPNEDKYTKAFNELSSKDLKFLNLLIERED